MKLKCALADYRVKPGRNIKLKDWPTRIKPLYDSKKQYQQLLDEYRTELAELQALLYAHNRYALLLIFQGMDAAGKDGAIRHVMSGINPQGCQVHSFKEPSSEELDHDFLWRTNKALPERGRIGIFNRSYYEEVLVVRVNPAVLEKQRLPAECVTKRIWQERFRDIVHLEDYLHRNGTRIIKFFLHISKEEQRQRLLARIDDPHKNWKFHSSDLEMRRNWDKFERAYEECLAATSTKHAPWYVIPADDKRNARLLISQIVIGTMKQLPMSYPRPSKEQARELAEIKRRLLAE